jgi:hypothetical protein
MPSKTSVFCGDAVYINSMNYRQETPLAPEIASNLKPVLLLVDTHRCVGHARVRWLGVRDVVESTKGVMLFSSECEGTNCNA